MMNKKFIKECSSEVKRESIVPQKKKYLKRAVIAVACVLAGLCILCGVLYAVSESLKSSGEDIENQEFNLDGKSYINYYEADYEADIFEDSDYLKKNRTIKYEVPTETGGVTIVLDEYEKTELTEGQRFFVSYFDAIISGDTKAYHNMFTKEYLDEPAGFEKKPAKREFPMQRIYDIKIKELGRTNPNDTSYLYGSEHAVFGVYEVSYKIMKNDGEFRPDLPSDAEKPLIFEIVTVKAGTENELTLIKNIYSYTDIVG